MTDRLSLPSVDVPAEPDVESVGPRLRLPVLTRSRRLGLAAIAVLLTGLGVKASEVDDRLTDDDRRYAALILAEAGVDERPTLGDFASEVAFVRAVQSAVLHVAPVSATGSGIPQGQAREPSDLYRERRGLCFDRSRVIEKILRVHGLRTRHVSAFHGASGSTSAWVLFDPHTRSHALTEVATSRGWMLADSNSVYVALARGKALPMDATAVARGARDPRSPQLDEPAPAGTFFATPFLPIRGLYSRHGRFFAPYNAIPDIAWSEMLSFDLPQPGDRSGGGSSCIVGRSCSVSKSCCTSASNRQPGQRATCRCSVAASLPPGPGANRSSAHRWRMGTMGLRRAPGRARRSSSRGGVRAKAITARAPCPRSVRSRPCST